jgi:SAM-dependent methyltransferase
MAHPTTVYPPFLASAAHPDRMAVRAHLRGFSAPPPDRCRVLELGCAAGWSLLAFGSTLPGSEFVGIDLSEAAIAQGQEWANRLGISNVHLRAGDATDIGEADGQFDYIFAHGFLSWVPEPVRVRVFEIIRDRLAPNGVAYLSYNTFPGGHLREMVRGVMRFHTRNFTADADRVAQARGLLGALLEPPVPESSYHNYLARLAERLETAPPEQILFDELADENFHFYFHEFVGMAAHFGLEFLAEAELVDFTAMLPPKARATLSRVGDRLAREQYLDFFIGRAFRQTMICRAGQQQPAADQVEMVRGLRIAAPMASEDGQRWTGAGGSSVDTSNALAQAIFARLGAAWPRMLSGQELLTAAPSPKEVRILANILVQCIESGIVRAHIVPPAAASQAGERPRASTLSRAQIGERFVSSLSCEAIELSTESDKKLLDLLDGSLTRAELAERMAMSLEELDAALRNFVRLELLENK